MHNANSLRLNRVALSPNGWTDDELTFLWFKHVFIPAAMARNPNNQPILLIMDGHGSHCTNSMIDYGISHSPPAHLFLFPPHTTHRIQPLDVGEFGIAQRLYLDRSDLRTYQGRPITRATVISEWMDLRPKFLTKKLILSSWEHTGNYPINPGIFNDEDYAPSHVSSTSAHLPEGYPIDDVHSDTESESELNGPEPTSNEESEVSNESLENKLAITYK